MTDPTEKALRNWARLEGVDQEAVVADYRHGGALAQLIRRMVGAPKTRKGRPPNAAENWRRFVLVVIAKRRIEGGSGEKGQSAFQLAADLERGRDHDRDPNATAPGRFKQAYARAKRHGWNDEDVPLGLSAFYSEPPFQRDKSPP